MSQAYRESTRWDIADPIRNVRLNDYLTDLDTILEEGTARGRVIPTKGTQFVDCDATTGWTASGVATATAVDSTRYVEGTGSIMLGASGAGTATYEHTFTAVDMTGTKKFRLYFWRPLSLASKASAVKIRVGSDSSNYYEWDLDVATTEYFGKWREEELNVFSGGASGVDLGSTVGSPDIANIDYLAVVVTATAAITSGDILIDDIRWATLGIDIASFGYFVGSNNGVATAVTSLSMTASSTNRIEVNASGTVSSTTGSFDVNKARISEVVTNANEITSITILRPDIIGGDLGGGPGGFQAITSTTYDELGRLTQFIADGVTYDLTYTDDQVWHEIDTIFNGSSTYTMNRDVSGNLTSITIT